MSRIQAQAVAIEWRRMADQDTYYALRDGPRVQRGQTAIHTLAKYLPTDHVALADRIACMHAEVHSGHGRGSGEIQERVQGGDGNASRETRLYRLSGLIRVLAGFSGAALRVGTDGHGCFRGICLGDTQAQMMRRVGYPHGSLATFRRLVQTTMIALADHEERRALDAESNMEAYSR